MESSCSSTNVCSRAGISPAHALQRRMTMALRQPSADDLHRLAAANYFELSTEEAAAFQSLLPEMFAALDTLDQTPAHLPAITHRERDPGARPSRQDDPLNAIVRRCSVKGAKSGKLAGKRLGIKDNVCIAGIPMTCASLVLEGYVPDIDATIITRILDAGGEITAILNMDNFAFSGGGDTSAYGPTRNPHNPEHLAGGSSGGSGAALYYDDIDLTIGGDQGGSIRIPASWCGVVGLKPTHSLVPYTGIVGIDATFDHAGPMGQSIADVAALLQVVAGKDHSDPRQRDVPARDYVRAVIDMPDTLSGVTLGVVTEGFSEEAGVQPAVVEAVEDAIDRFAALGARIRRISIPEHLHAGGASFATAIQGMTSLLESGGNGYGWKGRYWTELPTALGFGFRNYAND